MTYLKPEIDGLTEQIEKNKELIINKAVGHVKTAYLYDITHNVQDCVLAVKLENGTFIHFHANNEVQFLLSPEQTHTIAQVGRDTYSEVLEIYLARAQHGDLMTVKSSQAFLLEMLG